MGSFVKESRIDAPAAAVFGFHLRDDAIDRLIPPWEQATVIQRANISEIGSVAIIETRLFGLFPVRWVAEHTAFDPPRMFEDVQRSGPFASWRHRHIVEADGDGAILRDEIEYEPPGWFLGSMAAPFLVVPKLEKMFAYRHQVTREWCEQNAPKP